ncbi:hypothetical protein LCGC14_1507150 [marine sediment metagenome]|uniref:Uncharacterized protein n=1 Tax=marine sediment metagenome TaxID=412755 RepID=A0A0F9J2G1_9ZZZZ
MNVTIPGMVAEHRVITPNCRKRPYNDVVREVLSGVSKEIRSLHKAWPLDSGVQIHIVVTLERP